MDTLQQMKEQMQLLHDKLDQQPIVSDRLIRTAIRQRLHAIRRQALLLSAITVIGIPYCLWAIHMLGLPWSFAIATTIYLTISLGYRYWTHRGVNASCLTTEPLRQVALRVTRMKKRHARWLYFSALFLPLWMGWFAYELIHNQTIPAEEHISVLAGAIVGGLIGAVIGYMAYRRTQRLARNILKQLQDLHQKE